VEFHWTCPPIYRPLAGSGGQALAQLNSEFAGDESPEMKTYGTVLVKLKARQLLLDDPIRRHGVPLPLRQLAISSNWKNGKDTTNHAY
jgi:hypothetical protein